MGAIEILFFLFMAHTKTFMVIFLWQRLITMHVFFLPRIISKYINSGTHVVDFRMARALAEFGTHKKIIGRERHSAASFAN